MEPIKKIKGQLIRLGAGLGYRGMGRRQKLSFLAMLFISALMPTGLGYAGVMNSVLTFLILLTAKGNKLTRILAGIVFLGLSFYIPVGLQYGRIKYPLVVSAMQTSYLEASEFLREIDVTSLVLMLLCIVAIIVYISSARAFSLTKKMKVAALIVCIGLTVNSYPKRSIAGLIAYYDKGNKELADLARKTQGVDTLEISGVDAKYKNIVVVIGESVSRDYLSLYGYQHDTTPWLKSAPGYFATHYVSAAPNTFMSIPRTLSISDGLNQQTKNNAVVLANKAGFTTWWLSNQGFIGEYDTPSTVIAMNAQHQYFLKQGDYFSDNKDDFLLLDKLETLLNGEQKNSVFFIHMTGSHPDACERLNGFPVNFDIKGMPKISCYLASINKLDAFIKRADGLLKKTNQPYALVYFSDHGMTVDRSARPVRHGGEFKQNYSVPFFIMASDIKEHITVNQPVSAYDFLSIFSWLSGIKSKNIPAKSITDVNSGEIMVFDGSRMVRYASLPDNSLVE